MPESNEPTKRTAESFEDVFDALELAFWNDDFDDCESESLPIKVFENETRTNCKLRQKTSYDTVHGCSVMVYHFMYDSERNSVVNHREYMTINWINKDHKNLIFNILDLVLGSFKYDDEIDKAVYMETKAEDFDSMKGMAKVALSAVS